MDTLRRRRKRRDFEDGHVVEGKLPGHRRPGAVLPAVQLRPSKRTTPEAWDVGKVGRQGLGNVGGHETNDNSVRERSRVVLVQLAIFRSRLAGGYECRGCLAQGVLVDGKNGLSPLAPGVELLKEVMVPCS